MCRVTHVTCHMSHVMCHMSGVTCPVSNVTSSSQALRARELKFGEKVHLLPPVICHLSCVMCVMSHVTNFDIIDLRHFQTFSLKLIMPTAMFFLILKLDHCLVPQKIPQRNIHISMA